MVYYLIAFIVLVAIIVIILLLYECAKEIIKETKNPFVFLIELLWGEDILTGPLLVLIVIFVILIIKIFNS